MARLLADLRAGTPVVDVDGKPVGEVRALYALGGNRVVEYLLVRWSSRNEDALVPSDEVAHIDDGGVALAKDGSSYDSFPAFDPSANPELHRL